MSLILSVRSRECLLLALDVAGLAGLEPAEGGVERARLGGCGSSRGRSRSGRGSRSTTTASAAVPTTSSTAATTIATVTATAIAAAAATAATFATTIPAPVTTSITTPVTARLLGGGCWSCGRVLASGWCAIGAIAAAATAATTTATTTTTAFATFTAFGPAIGTAAFTVVLTIGATVGIGRFGSAVTGQRAFGCHGQVHRALRGGDVADGVVNDLAIGADLRSRRLAAE